MSTPTPYDARELVKAAEHIEKTAKALRKQAEQITYYAGLQDQTREHMRHLAAAGREAARRAGYNKADLRHHVHAVAEKYDTFPDTVMTHGTRACETRAAHARAIRNREIIRLAKTGHTNTEIAAKMKVSTRTVTRAITGTFRTP